MSNVEFDLLLRGAEWDTDERGGTLTDFISEDCICSGRLEERK
jgi:hypothetical protein